MAAGIQPELVRSVGLAGLTAIALNGIVGAGIFVLPATVARTLGPASPVAYLVAALATALIVLCFAEAGSRSDRTGGPYVYAREAFGGFVGFQVGWMFVIARLTAVVAVTNAFVSYLGALWPLVASGPGRMAGITVLLAALTLVNLVGIRQASWVLNVFTLGKMAPLLLFVALGLPHVDGAAWSLGPPGAWAPLKEASLSLIFAFGGFEFASIPTEEAVDSRRNLPIALLAAVALTAVLYICIQIVVLGTLPGAAASPTPLASAAGAFLGPAGMVMLTLAAILSTTGTNTASILVAPRMLFALARGGQLPALLGRIHSRHRTPYVAIVLFAIPAWALAIYGTFGQFAALSAIARLLFYLSTCLAVPFLRRIPGAARPRFLLPGGPVVPTLAVGVSLWLLSACTSSQVAMGVAALAVGAVLYLVARLARRGGGDTATDAAA